jgi:GTP-binding protein HflX
MARFSSKAVSEHAEVPLADGGQWEEIVASWQARAAARPAGGAVGNACYVASVGPSRDPTERAAQLAEISSLVRNQGDRVVGEEIVHLAEPNPRTLLGKGKAEEIATRARAAGAALLVLDAELSPSQARNLEDAAGIAVADREGVILNVFLRHARTRRARIQVEAAQLAYLRPRIRGVGLDMDQQAAGIGRARGPGETASELLARKLDDRLAELSKALRRADTAERTARKRRDGCRRIALVGYTNAGKTSLMNALTGAGLSARDMPFETLDTTSRCLSRHGGDVLLSDTVGFIRRLPDRLLASFESTLAEVVDASLLCVVVDASDAERALHLRTTRELIARVGAGDVPRFYVFNKRDRLPVAPAEDELRRLSQGDPCAAISTRDAAAVEALAEALLEAARRDEEEASIFVPYAAREALSLVYGGCRVLTSSAAEAGLELRVRAPAAVLARIRAALGPGEEATR